MSPTLNIEIISCVNDKLNRISVQMGNHNNRNPYIETTMNYGHGGKYNF